MDVPATFSIVKAPKRALVRTPGRPRITILHPGYGARENYLFALPAVDEIVRPSSQDRAWGLHHGTLLTAGGIVAGNAFSDVYFSHDQYGQQPVKTPRDGILESGRYWMQLDSIAGGMTNTRATPATSSVPPPSSVSSSTATKEQYRYAVVPSFADWQFPHDKLPMEWEQPHNPPDEQDPSLPVPDSVLSRCYITDVQIGLERAHILPASEIEWYQWNQMQHYSALTPGHTGIDHQSNKILLLAHLHWAFDRSLFVVVPKPSAGPSTPGPQSSTSTLSPRIKRQQYAFAAHVLSDNNEASDFRDKYHNFPLQPKYSKQFKHEFLFARFAWALFPYLTHFVYRSDSATTRNFMVLEGDDYVSKSMTGLEYVNFREKRGQGKIGSRKRPGDSMNQNREPADEDDENDAYKDDVYEERWGQRSASRERWLSRYDSDYEDDCDCEDDRRGRPRHPRVSSDLDSQAEDLPALSSSSYTAAGSNESTDLLTEDEPQARQEMTGLKKSAAPTDSGLGNLLS
ncbi:putative conserved hypothetical protein [Rosellinia necatrix]|uniref:HNH nuclease domain-containing protein n=1 Tax=Rosellinia necatrix TaxID=77044 RepID=A0A1W2TFP7_ROSNE|nr:putative conserved hypothetical protein [Rosellinia necatrix]